MIVKKLFNLFEIAALLFAIGATAAAPALPAPGTYAIDPDHSFAYFGARHHVVGLVRGRFDKVTGTITVSQDPAACSVDVTIDTSTISTQVTERDKDLRSPAYFDVKKFPTMTYHGRGIRPVSESSWTMDGSLTMHGVTKVVPLTFTFNGVFPDAKPGSPARAAFHGSAATKRADFGMGRATISKNSARPRRRTSRSKSTWKRTANLQLSERSARPLRTSRVSSV